jgi:hypothetical protein
VFAAHPRVPTDDSALHGNVVTFNKNAANKKQQNPTLFVPWAELPARDFWHWEARLHDYQQAAGAIKYGFTYRGPPGQSAASLQPGDQLLRVQGVGVLGDDHAVMGPRVAKMLFDAPTG